MTRILALVTEAFGGNGGIAQYNRDLFCAIASEAQYSLDIIPRFVAGEVKEATENTHQYKAQRNKFTFVGLSFYRALKTRPDIVFCGHLFMSPLAMVVAKLSGAKLAIQLHGIEIWSPPSPLQRRALEAADLILCVSRDTRAKVLGYAKLSPEKVRVQPNTVSPEFTPGDRIIARSQFGWSEDQFVLLSVGRLASTERYKGQDKVIEALPRLRRINKNVHYAISGEGDDRPRLEALSKEHGVADAVTFLGHVPHSQLCNLYRSADLFVLPSTGEGFGIVFLEAMACGTPALGLAIGGATDALVDGALGAAPTDNTLTAALDDAVQNPRVGGIPLANRVEEHFGRRQFTQNVLRLLSKCR